MITARTVASDTAALAGEGSPLLSVEDLRVDFTSPRGTVRAVDGVTWSVKPGEIMALVGESGCGKSVSALAVMRLLAQPAGKVTDGRVMFEGRDLLALKNREMREIRGRDISLIFQDPMTSLNPVLTIRFQIMEPLKIHLGLSDAEASARAVDLLRQVGIADAERRLDQYPHQFSGGMRQRVMIAIGIACNPKLIIADEPTTALDVTVQAQILELMKDLVQRLNIALVIITHNLGIVARYADRVAVMYAGRIVEQGPAERIFARPSHPYTLGLLRSIPRLDHVRTVKLDTIEGLPPNLAHPPAGCRFAPRCRARIEVCAIDPPLYQSGIDQVSACHRADEVVAGTLPIGQAPLPAPPDEKPPAQILLDVRNLSKHFHLRIGGALGREVTIPAVNDVSLTIEPGRTLGVVGESGCGKTTLGRTILRLEEPTEGQILFDGEDVRAASRAQMKTLRSKIQVIFQDPYSSLNPRMTVGGIVGEALRVHRRTKTSAQTRDRIASLLGQVGLDPAMAERYPHQLSGGQRQRVGIARALSMEPRFIVCDEPVSALDVSIQAQIMNLLDDLQQRLGLAYLFIAHDLAVVRHLSHKIAVMYLGRVMEWAERDALYAEPLHPYTRALLDAAPVPDPVAERARAPRPLQGEIPSPLAPPPGCVFNTRCPLASAECREIVPPLREVLPGHFAACIKV